MCSFEVNIDETNAADVAKFELAPLDRSKSLQRLRHLGLRLRQKKAVVATILNRSFFDTILKPRTLFDLRQSTGAAAYFWGHRIDGFQRLIPEAGKFAHVSEWRLASLNARHECNPLFNDSETESKTMVLRRVIESMGECPGLLAELANNESSEVRIAVAENGHSTLNTMFALAGDANPDVRMAIAENHNAPIAILQFLTEDSNPYVTARAQRTLSRLIQTDVNTSLLHRLTRNQKTRRRAIG